MNLYFFVKSHDDIDEKRGYRCINSALSRAVIICYPSNVKCIELTKKLQRHLLCVPGKVI